MSEQPNLVSINNVGTFYLESKEFASEFYVIVSADLPRCEGDLTTNLDSFNTSSNGVVTVNFDFSYPPGQPLIGAVLETYALPVIVPEAGFKPNWANVYENGSPNNNKKGEINTNQPSRMPTQTPVTFPENFPRCIILSSAPMQIVQEGNPPSTPPAISHYFIVVLAKMDENNPHHPILDFAINGSSIDCSINRSFPGNSNSKEAIVVIPSNTFGEFTHVTLEGHTSAPLDYNAALPFYYGSTGISDGQSLV